MNPNNPIEDAIIGLCVGAIATLFVMLFADGKAKRIKRRFEKNRQDREDSVNRQLESLQGESGIQAINDVLPKGVPDLSSNEMDSIESFFGGVDSVALIVDEKIKAAERQFFATAEKQGWNSPAANKIEEYCFSLIDLKPDFVKRRRVQQLLAIRELNQIALSNRGDGDPIESSSRVSQAFAAAKCFGGDGRLLREKEKRVLSEYVDFDNDTDPIDKNNASKQRFINSSSCEWICANAPRTSDLILDNADQYFKKAITDRNRKLESGSDDGVAE